MRILILSLLALCACRPIVDEAEAQGGPSSGNNQSAAAYTANCLSTNSSGGNVDVSVPSTDCIDVSSAANTCGAACPANVSLKFAAGKCLQLASGDTLCDSSGVANFSGSVSMQGNILNGANGSTSLGANTAAFSKAWIGNSGFTNLLEIHGDSAIGRFAWDTTASSGATHFDILNAGAGDVQLPRIANASLLSCTASTEDATHSQAGALAYDTTNNCIARCNGTAWACLAADSTGTSDMTLNVYDPLTVITFTGNIGQWGPMTSAGTIKDLTHIALAAGGGSGSETIKLATVSGCGSGVIGTLSVSCAGAAGQNTAGTGTSTFAAGSTLYMCLTGNCSTADVAGNITVHYTQP